ncbi:FAD:protein FMN transferase [Sideroxyarcus emersonii]|uniref:FAD:protein FMN transferase n=1 Tax=Sideroxyarcus emersonii TaxID=2764705 RepID=A0AAN1X7L1_9PROT|nr:FAD:protein FMN transferase [Sideroxyarcus emersonii]BCK86325.1 FAD:protein FMN transferase [Sideroxyarcus emersonii]
MSFRLLLLPLFALLAACNSGSQTYEQQGYVFGTLVEVTIYGEDEARAKAGITAVMQEFQRLHDKLHAWRPSELSELNVAIAQGKSKAVSPELAAMLQDAARVSAQSDGLFDPAIGGLIQAWGFQADDFKAVLPDGKKIAALVKANPQMSDLAFTPALPSAGLSHGNGDVVVGSRNRAVKIDLGGYAKGYALDRAADILKQQGIRNALINIGGNVLALGQHGSRAWRIGIQHPRKPGPLATLELHDGEAIGTSGDYQRFFELGGKRYCHLIDPRTGYPVQGVQAVTILTHGAKAGLLSDESSKPLFISGVQGWLAAAQKMHLDEALLVDDQGAVHLTAAMQKRLKFADESTVRKIEP